MLRHRHYLQSFVFWFFLFLVFTQISSLYWIEIILGTIGVGVLVWICSKP